jgi:hypothetical protein
MPGLVNDKEVGRPRRIELWYPFDFVMARWKWRSEFRLKVLRKSKPDAECSLNGALGFRSIPGPRVPNDALRSPVAELPRVDI